MQHMILKSPPLGISFAGVGPLVILVHGMGGDRTTWFTQIEALSKQFTAVSVDLRGYGDSGDPPHALDFKRDFTADLLAVMDAFGVDRAHLVGLSMGGRVVRAACLLAPQRVASVTLANTSPGFDHMNQEQLQAFIDARSKVLTGDQFPPSFGLDQAKAMMAENASMEALQLAAAAMGRLRLRNYLEVLQASTLQDRGDRLEDIACPVHIITSDQDRVYPEVVSRQMLARIPHASLTRISGAGHLANIEQPQAFNVALLTFLHDLPPEACAGSPIPTV